MYTTNLKSTTDRPTSRKAVTLEDIMDKLVTFGDRLDNIEAALDTIDVRLSDIDLPSGDGFERDE